VSPLHRTQSGACVDRWPAGGLPLVELSGECAGTTRQPADAASRVRGAGPECRSPAVGVSRPVLC
jgi:hypothetical protein